MRHRAFGKTGFRISTLGFGAMRLPMRRVDGTEEVDEELSIALLRRAFELGVNYVDTAWVYVGGRSETIVGKAIKGWRGRVRVSTKYPVCESKSRDNFRVVLEAQLKRLDLDCIDFYHLHGLDLDKWNDVVMPQHLLDEMAKAIDEGLIRFASFSFHDEPEVMRQFVDTGCFSSVLCQYNLLDRANEDAMAYAAEKGLGVAVMGPLGGGRLAAPVGYLSGAVSAEKGTPEIALRFVLSNRDVCCALSGMNAMEQVERNAAVAAEGRALSELETAEVRNIMDSRKRLGDLYCTGCKYCMPCPNEVNIPVCLESLISHRVYGFTEFAARRYSLIGGPWVSGKQADACVDCGQCEIKCPQKVSIRRHLRDAHAELGAKRASL
jgi:predicted aldo/keto reductase-like oxidoreductase